MNRVEVQADVGSMQREWSMLELQGEVKIEEGVAEEEAMFALDEVCEFLFVYVCT